MLLSRKFFASLGGTIQMDLSFASIPRPDDQLARVPKEPKMPLHVEKFSTQGNRAGRIAQVNHIDSQLGEPDLMGDIGLNISMDAKENVFMNQDSPHPLLEEDFPRGQIQNNQEIRRSINQLEGVIDVLHKMLGEETDSPNENHNIHIDYSDPGPSNHHYPYLIRIQILI